MLMTLDDEREDDELVVVHPYFETRDPVAWDEDTSYVGSGQIQNTRTYDWNHGLGETITALIDAGLVIERVDEHRSLDWKYKESMSELNDRFYLPEQQRDLVPFGVFNSGDEVGCVLEPGTVSLGRARRLLFPTLGPSDRCRWQRGVAWPRANALGLSAIRRLLSTLFADALAVGDAALAG